jgi:hypothetical protein
MEEDLEEITKDCLADLLIPVDPVEMSDPDKPETTHDTPKPSKTKKTEEVQELRSASGNTALVSPDQGGDAEVEYINGTGDKQNQGEVTNLRDESDLLKKRKFSLLKPSSWKK